MTEKKSYKTDTSAQFNKHFTQVIYDPSKISHTVNSKHDNMQLIQNALAYFATAVSYECKMFNPIKLFTTVIYGFRKKLEFLSLAGLFSLILCMWVRLEHT